MWITYMPMAGTCGELTFLLWTIIISAIKHVWILSNLKYLAATAATGLMK